MPQQNRKGFTLIELLIVVVIIGILAAIAIPKFSSTKEKAYISAMKSDLRNLATAQEGYFSDNLQYTQNLNDMNFVPSTGVNISVDAASGSGWRATATHNSVAGQSCEIRIGSEVQAGQPEGEPVCTTAGGGGSN